MANEIRRRILVAYGPCGFNFVDLKCAEHNCVVTPILAYFVTKFYHLFSTKIYKYPHPTTEPLTRSLKGAVESIACGRNAAQGPRATAKKTLRAAKSSLSTPFSLE